MKVLAYYGIILEIITNNNIMNDLNFITQKKKELKWPIIFLWSVLIVSILLFLFNLKIGYDMSDLDARILERESDISILKNDPKVQVYSLIETNKSTINILEKRSNLTNYIKHIDAISKKYDISFDNFSIANWKITMQAFTQSSEKWIAYKKINEFMDSYRNEELALLDLNFISNFEWMDSIKFNVEFSIK